MLNSQDETRKHSERRRTLTAGALFAVALPMAAVTFYGLQRAQAGPLSPEFLARDHKRILALNAARAHEVEKRLPAELAVLERLRGEWRPWVAQHAHELAAMRSAPAGSYAAEEAVYHALPQGTAQDSPVTAAEVNRTGFMMSWSRSPDSLTARTSALRQWEQHTLDSAAHYRRHDADEQHDVRFIATINGPIELTLWASGRITRRDFGVKYDAKGSSWMTSTERELVPAIASGGQ